MACTTIASGAIVATSLCGLFYFSDSFRCARLLSPAGKSSAPAFQNAGKAHIDFFPPRREVPRRGGPDCDAMTSI